MTKVLYNINGGILSKISNDKYYENLLKIDFIMQMPSFLVYYCIENCMCKYFYFCTYDQLYKIKNTDDLFNDQQKFTIFDIVFKNNEFLFYQSFSFPDVLFLFYQQKIYKIQLSFTKLPQCFLFYDFTQYDLNLNVKNMAFNLIDCYFLNFDGNLLTFSFNNKDIPKFV